MIDYLQQLIKRYIQDEKKRKEKKEILINLQVVVVIGGGPSAYDISEDIAKLAKEVHLSSRSSQVEFSNRCGFNNVWQHPQVQSTYMIKMFIKLGNVGNVGKY